MPNDYIAAFSKTRKHSELGRCSYRGGRAQHSTHTHTLLYRTRPLQKRKLNARGPYSTDSYHQLPRRKVPDGQAKLVILCFHNNTPFLLISVLFIYSFPFLSCALSINLEIYFMWCSLLDVHVLHFVHAIDRVPFSTRN